MKRYAVERLPDLESLDCPCGQTRRGFVEDARGTATVHLLSISAESRVHYHERLTEIYVILEGTGHIELDGDRVPLEPMTAVLMHPGCRHRAVGRLQVIVVAIPAFDPQDEHFD